MRQRQCNNAVADKNFLAKLLAKRASHPENSPKGIRISLSGPLLTALSLVLVCAVAWAFFMGFMVGRGQSPHAEIHAMTGMLEPQEMKQAKPAAPETAEAEPAVPQPPAIVQTPAASSEPIAAAQPQKVPNAAQADNRQRPQKAAQQKAAQSKTEPEARFAYTYQLAAFKSRSEAENLQKAAAGKGLKTVVRKSGKVYLVTASITGGSAEVAALQRKLASLKLGKPLQLSKKTIAPKNSPKQTVKKQGKRGDRN